MYLEVFSDNPFDTNCWLLAPEGGDEAIVVDPGFEPDRVRALLDSAGKRAVAVLATHGHYDHIGSAGEFCGDDIPFYIHEADELALTDARAWGSGFPTPPTPVKDVRTVSDGETLDIAGFRIDVIQKTKGLSAAAAAHWVDSTDRERQAFVKARARHGTTEAFKLRDAHFSVPLDGD